MVLDISSDATMRLSFAGSGAFAAMFVVVFSKWERLSMSENLEISNSGL